MSHTNFYKQLRDMGVMEGGAAGQRGGSSTLSAGIVHLHLSLIARDNTADGHARTKVGAHHVCRMRRLMLLTLRALLLLAGIPARIGPGGLPAREAHRRPCGGCGAGLHPGA